MNFPTPCTFNIPGTGTATTDDWGNIVQPTPTSITTNCVFSQLTSAELVARDQLQDDSQFKLYIPNNTENKTIDNTATVTVNSILYRINGKPKQSPLKHSWITVYISEN